MSHGGMTDEVPGNLVAELRKRGTFGGFSEEKMQSLIELMWYKAEYTLKNPQEAADQLEYCSDSKLLQSLLNF